MDSDTSIYRTGRLGFRPEQSARWSAPVGSSPLGLDGRRDGVLRVPTSAVRRGAAPLLVLLHGAGATGEQMVDLVQHQSDQHALVLLAPDAREATWDVIARGRYGEDVAFLDTALRATLGRCAIDPDRIAIGGFSDGASYALSMGIGNGDVFGHVLAYSPGFAAPQLQTGRPGFFLTHGTHDQVLPVARCSRRLVPQLRQAGYDVEYREFDGGHTMPSDLIDESMHWFLDGNGGSDGSVVAEGE